MSQFAFKQFIIGQNHAAMKVSTDGILLGAWALLDGTGKIIDVGSGTGLLALMLKQRAPQSEVHAVELDNDAIFDAKQNVAQIYGLIFNFITVLFKSLIRTVILI